MPRVLLQRERNGTLAANVENGWAHSFGLPLPINIDVIVILIDEEGFGRVIWQQGRGLH